LVSAAPRLVVIHQDHSLVLCAVTVLQSATV
jgi:hypothetical protein